MKVLTSTLSNSLAGAVDDWVERTGLGPCGAYAAYLREEGWGDVAFCYAHTSDGTRFPHYVIVQDGAIIDLANQMGERLTYTDVQILDDSEMPEAITEDDVNWMAEHAPTIE
jgi:hypothetical protein